MNLKINTTLKSLLLLSIVAFIGGCKPVSMEKANEAMLKKQYAISAHMYDQLASNSDISKQDRQTAAYRGAESYRFNHQPKKALKLYNKAIQYGAQDPETIYRLAQMHKQMGEYEQAIKNFKLYQKEMPGDERIETMVQ